MHGLKSTNFVGGDGVAADLLHVRGEGCTDSTVQLPIGRRGRRRPHRPVGCIDPTAINYNSGARRRRLVRIPYAVDAADPARRRRAERAAVAAGRSRYLDLLAVGTTAFVQADQAALVAAFKSVNLPESDVEVISVTGNPATLVLRVTEGPQWARVMAKCATPSRPPRPASTTSEASSARRRRRCARPAVAAVGASAVGAAGASAGAVAVAPGVSTIRIAATAR